jgi:hypothetical protein
MGAGSTKVLSPFPSSDPEDTGGLAQGQGSIALLTQWGFFSTLLPFGILHLTLLTFSAFRLLLPFSFPQTSVYVAILNPVAPELFSEVCPWPPLTSLLSSSVPHLIRPHTGGMAPVVEHLLSTDPELKPHYCQKTKQNKISPPSQGLRLP